MTTPSDDKKAVVGEAVNELKELVNIAYSTMGGCLDAIQDITEITDATVDDVRNGVAEVINHTRKLLGLKRNG